MKGDKGRESEVTVSVGGTEGTTSEGQEENEVESRGGKNEN